MFTSVSQMRKLRLKLPRGGKPRPGTGETAEPGGPEQRILQPFSRRAGTSLGAMLRPRGLAGDTAKPVYVTAIGMQLLRHLRSEVPGRPVGLRPPIQARKGERGPESASASLCDLERAACPL